MTNLVSAWEGGYHTAAMSRRNLVALAIALPLAFAATVWAAGKSAPEPDGKATDKSADKAGPGTASDGTVLDIAEFKSKLTLLHDGKGHYIAAVPFEVSEPHLFYGDGKNFHGQITISGGRSGDEQWNLTFWEPRVEALWKSSIDFTNKTYKVRCGDRETEFKLVASSEQDKLLSSAIFHKPLWNHRAYALARDNKGNYYYVDRLREPEHNKSFRLFSGPRGNLKPLKMTNVVSDSQGDIFTTKKGELRLVLDRKHPTWIAGKNETELISLPLEDNRVMIYSELGVYTGQRLGTPCDDLL